MEYYKLHKLDKLIPLKKQNPFTSKHPFRLGVAGTSESEKTEMVVHQEFKYGIMLRKFTDFRKYTYIYGIIFRIFTKFRKHT
jgi:hypothetical protein